MAEEAVKTDAAEPRKLSKRALKQERMKDLSTGERRYLLRLALQKRIWKVFRFVILFGLGFVIMYPIIYMISCAFREKADMSDPTVMWIPRHYTFDVITETLDAMDYWETLGTTLLLNIGCSLFQVISCAVTGYGFARFKFRGRDFLFAMLVFTMMVPAQVTMITTFIIIDDIGLYDSVWALIIPSFVNVFGIYLCKQFCEEIPRELIESARIDGAGDFAIYWRIVIPQIRPAIGALAIFTFMEYWNDYLNPLIYLSSTEKMTLPLALSYFSTQHSTDLSATMAASALIMIPAAIVFIIFQKQFIKGLSMTGMK